MEKLFETFKEYVIVNEDKEVEVLAKKVLVTLDKSDSAVVTKKVKTIEELKKRSAELTKQRQEIDLINKGYKQTIDAEESYLKENVVLAAVEVHDQWKQIEVRALNSVLKLNAHTATNDPTEKEEVNIQGIYEDLLALIEEGNEWAKEIIDNNTQIIEKAGRARAFKIEVKEGEKVDENFFDDIMNWVKRTWDKFVKAFSRWFRGAEKELADIDKRIAKL